MRAENLASGVWRLETSSLGAGGTAAASPAAARLDLDVGHLGEVAVQPRDALDLALGGKALVEAFHAELAHALGPGGEAFLPALLAPVGGLGIGPRQVGAHPDHRLQRDRLGDHVVGVPPRGAPHLLAGLEEIAHDRVVAVGFARGMAGALDLPPFAAHPAVQLVEELGLQYPFLLLAAPAQ